MYVKKYQLLHDIKNAIFLKLLFVPNKLSSFIFYKFWLTTRFFKSNILLPNKMCKIKYSKSFVSTRNFLRSDTSTDKPSKRKKIIADKANSRGADALCSEQTVKTNRKQYNKIGPKNAPLKWWQEPSNDVFRTCYLSAEHYSPTV